MHLLSAPPRRLHLHPTTLTLALSLLARTSHATASASASDDHLITAARIKVQLFATPSFLNEVSVDAYNGQCLSLDNNLIDGRVHSVLVGGHDVRSVLLRDDYWSCRFYDNYTCNTDDNLDSFLSIPDGANNLGSIGWGTRIHGLRCRNSFPGDT
ncbi:hypothetical protein BDW02DRAFT_573243 [Decorospora gaudefroyi]|uniref:Uncharacterized protein n=1 Tax=Decorospora gaudefroyi TaxID=184978 RepID=A0A6A5K2E7_9PLEO|nr:hypothetical protein BDW02DRAFT_573243 [Decorospora gaudefroyi]